MSGWARTRRSRSMPRQVVTASKARLLSRSSASSSLRASIRAPTLRTRQSSSRVQRASHQATLHRACSRSASPSGVSSTPWSGPRPGAAALARGGGERAEGAPGLGDGKREMGDDSPGGPSPRRRGSPFPRSCGGQWSSTSWCPAGRGPPAPVSNAGPALPGRARGGCPVPRARWTTAGPRPCARPPPGRARAGARRGPAPTDPSPAGACVRGRRAAAALLGDGPVGAPGPPGGRRSADAGGRLPGQDVAPTLGQRAEPHRFRRGCPAPRWPARSLPGAAGPARRAVAGAAVLGPHLRGDLQRRRPVRGFPGGAPATGPAPAKPHGRPVRRAGRGISAGGPPAADGRPADGGIPRRLVPARSRVPEAAQAAVARRHDPVLEHRPRPTRPPCG